MAEVSNRTKRLVGEIAVLICVLCFWARSSQTMNIDSVKASVLKQVVKADPENIEVYRFLTHYYIKLGRHEEAARALSQALRIEPDNADSWRMLGDLYSDCGRHEEAMGAYRQAANLETDNPQVHYQLGEAYLKIGRKDLALEEYQKLKDLDEQLANDLLNLIDQTPQG